MTSGDKIGWRLPLAIMFATHAISTILLRLVPTLAPEFIRQFDLSEAFIGALGSFANIGSVVLIGLGTGALRAMGSYRAIQYGLLACAAGAFLLMISTPWVALAASLMIGIGHAPAHPAGNDILRRRAPERYQTLIFSIKLAAVPLGGVIGGLILPVIAQTFGLRAALLAAAMLSLAAVAAMLPLKRRLTSEAPAQQNWDQAFSTAQLTGPVRLVISSPRLKRLAIIGALLAMVQSIWFVYLTSYLVLGLGYSLITAGQVFAVMQGTCIFGRIVFGWLGDNLISGRTLLGLSLIFSTLATALLGLAAAVESAWYVWAIAIIGGLGATSWTGVHLAETLRNTEIHQVYEATSGILIAVGAGIAVGPLVFSLLLEFGSWSSNLFLIALLPLMGLWALGYSHAPKTAMPS